MRKRDEQKWEKYEELRKMLREEIEELQKELETKEKEVRHVKGEQEKLS